MSTATLPLDADSLRVEDLSLPALMRELNLQQRPNWLLRKIMNALEQQRQGKGLGWSRAWNKYGLNVFRTHVQNQRDDPDYFAPVTPLLTHLLPLVPANYQSFVNELLADPALMVFTFYHNHASADAQYEGLTLSFGRKVVGDPSKRDRLDLILEDRRLDPATQLEDADWETDSQERLSHALTALDERSRTILQRRWLDDDKATLHELAAEYSVSAERIRQLEQGALKKLRSSMLA